MSTATIAPITPLSLPRRHLQPVASPAPARPARPALTPLALPRPRTSSPVVSLDDARRGRSAAWDGASGRTALLVDLDNLAIKDGSALRPKQVARILRHLMAAAGPVQYRKVIAPRQMVQRYGAQLAAAGLPWDLVEVGKDAADNALLELADDLAARGFGRFVVASADHAFAPLAERFPTKVVVRAGQRVSHALERNAVQVLQA